MGMTQFELLDRMPRNVWFTCKQLEEVFGYGNASVLLNRLWLSGYVDRGYTCLMGDKRYRRLVYQKK